MSSNSILRLIYTATYRNFANFLFFKYLIRVVRSCSLCLKCHKSPKPLQKALSKVLHDSPHCSWLQFYVCTLPECMSVYHSCVPGARGDRREHWIPGTGAINAMRGLETDLGSVRTRALHYSLTHLSSGKQRKSFFSVFLFTFFIFKVFYSFYTRPQFPLPSLLPTSSPSHSTIHSSENVRPYVPQLNKRLKKTWHISTTEYHSVVTSWNLQADRWNEEEKTSWVR